MQKKKVWAGIAFFMLFFLLWPSIINAQKAGLTDEIGGTEKTCIEDEIQAGEIRTAKNKGDGLEQTVTSVSGNAGQVLAQVSTWQKEVWRFGKGQQSIVVAEQIEGGNKLAMPFHAEKGVDTYLPLSRDWAFVDGRSLARTTDCSFRVTEEGCDTTFSAQGDNWVTVASEAQPIEEELWGEDTSDFWQIAGTEWQEDATASDPEEEGQEGVADAQQAEEEIEAQMHEGVEVVLDGVDLSALEELYRQMPQLFSGMSLEEAVREITENGLTQYTAEQALNAVGEALKNALLGNTGYIAQILVMLLITGVLTRLQGSFNQANVSKAAFWAGYIVVSSLAVSMLVGCVNTARQAIETLNALFETLTPLLVTLLTGIGGIQSSNLLSPVMAGLTGSVFWLINVVVFPAILAAAVLSLSSNISSTIKLNKMSSLIQSGVKWMLGIVMIVFLGITAIKGLTGAALDGLTFKTAKFTVDKMVPIIGGMFSDTLDTLMACGLIVKNAVGVVGLIMLAGAMLAPLASLMVNLFLFRFAAAVAEPFAHSGCVKMLESLGEIVLLLLVTLLAAVTMAFITVALLIGAADVTMAMR